MFKPFENINFLKVCNGVGVNKIGFGPCLFSFWPPMAQNVIKNSDTYSCIKQTIIICKKK